jgi:hypothetical protein
LICSFNFLIFLAVCLNISTVINIKILTNSNQQTQSYKFTSHIAAFLSVVLITEMLEICIQTSYDQIVQLILKSYLPVVYGTSLSWIFIVLAHWNNSPWVDMLLYSNTLSKFKSNQFLLLLHNAECFIVEKQQISMLLSLTQQGPKPMIYQTRGEHANHSTTVVVLEFLQKWWNINNSNELSYHCLKTLSFYCQKLENTMHNIEPTIRI